MHLVHLLELVHLLDLKWLWEVVHVHRHHYVFIIILRIKLLLIDNHLNEKPLQNTACMLLPIHHFYHQILLHIKYIMILAIALKLQEVITFIKDLLQELNLTYLPEVRVLAKGIDQFEPGKCAVHLEGGEIGFWVILNGVIMREKLEECTNMFCIYGNTFFVFASFSKPFGNFGAICKFLYSHFS